MKNGSIAYLLAFVGVVGLTSFAGSAQAQPGTGPVKRTIDKKDDKKADKKKEESNKATAGPKVGDRAPDFSLKDSAGKTVKLSDLKGKVVVIDVWATWCGYCKEGMPSIQKISEEFKDKEVVVYGLNAQGKTPGDAAKYMKDNNYTYGLLLNGDATHAKYGGGGIPQLWVIDPEGKIAMHDTGFNKNKREEFEKNLRDSINKVLPAKAETKKDEKTDKDANKDKKDNSGKKPEKKTDAPAQKPATPGGGN